jgi:hypothetical protein
MEDLITYETFLSINKLCSYIIFFVFNTLFLGRFLAEFLCHKYILKAQTILSEGYNPYIYMPLVIIACVYSVIPVIFPFDGMYGKYQNTAINGYFQFLIIFLIPSFISLFFIRFKKEFVTQIYYKLNFKINELRIIKSIFILTPLIICFVPTIFSLMKVDLSEPKVELLGPILLIVILLPMIELIISSMIFLNKSIQVQRIIDFKKKKMKWIEEVTNKDNTYPDKYDYLPMVDIGSYLVIKHGWDFMYMNPDDKITLNEHSGYRTVFGISNKPKFIIHDDIRKLFPNAYWSSENQEYNPAINAPSTLVSEVLKVNKKIMFSSSIPGDKDNIFKKFMTQTLKKLYIISRHNNNFEIQEVEYNWDETENLDNYKMLSLEYDILTIPNYLQLSLKDE